MALLDRQLAAVPQQELDLARLERRPKVLRDIQSLLDTRLNEAQLAHQSYAPEVRVLDPAVAPLRPVRPNRTLIVFIGVAAGLVAGAGGALVRRALNPAVRSRRDVRVAVGLPVLGLIPRLAAPPGTLPLVAERARPRPALDPAMPQSVLRVTALRRTAGYTFLGASRGAVQPPELPEPATNGSESVPPPAGHAKRLPGSGRSAPPARVARVAPTEAGQAMAEAYTVFQANLVALRSKPAAKTLLLTSPLAGDGKTTSALNLAVALALRGLRVVLLDADLRRGRVHEAFEAPPEPGLADVLGGRCQLPQALHTLQVGDDHSLDYLTRGKARSHPTGLLDSGAMRELLAALALEYDAVILDSPPANVLTDAAVLGAMVDEVVIVARAGSTDGEALRYAREQLEHVRAPLAGVLLNDIEFAKDIAYDRAYRFHALSDAYLRPKDQG